MRRWLILDGMGLATISGCAKFRERQRLKTEMLREGVGLMKGMNEQFAPSPIGPGVMTPVPVSP